LMVDAPLALTAGPKETFRLKFYLFLAKL